MRVVIIGGRGLIGSAVTRLALSHGHEVLTLTRQRIIPGTEDSPAVLASWDGVDSKILAGYIDRKDCLLNLAGESIGNHRWTTRQKEILLQSRLQPARAVVEAFNISQTPPEKLIQASAIGYYGTGFDARKEGSPPGKDYLANFAVEWENSTVDVESSGVKRVVIRTGVVLSRDGGALGRLMLPYQLMVGGPIGSGKQVYSWIHIDDVAGAILHLMEKKDSQGIYNLTAPQPLSNAEFGKILAKLMKKPHWIAVPGFALKMLLGEMSTLVLDGQRVLPTRLQEAGYGFLYPTLEPALRDLLKPS